MLESFSVSNYKNFKQKITLDLKAANYNFNNEIVSENKLIKFAMIYGYNACGKSNLMLALFDIVYSLTDLNHNERSNNNQNYQNVYNKDKLVEFEYKFNFDNNILIYKYKKKSIEEIFFEELIINDKTYIYFDKSKNSSFKQNFNEIKTLKPDLQNIKLSAVKYLYSNSKLDKKNSPSKTFCDFMNFVQRMLLFWSLQDRSYIGYKTGTSKIIDEIINNNWIDEYNNFLIENNIHRKIAIKKLPDGSNVAYYDFGDNNYLPIAGNMSNGESALLLFFYWWELCKGDDHPSLLCIDEFDAFYHIKLSKNIVNNLKKMKNIQILITSHNPNLISNEISRPDAYYIIENNEINSLNNSTDKEIRQAQNLERMFKSGTFNNFEK